MKKILLIASYLLLITSANFSFAQSYPASCPSEARAIVDAVGGCAEVDKNAYTAVYEQCCALSASAPNRSAALWISLAVVAVGLVAGIRYTHNIMKSEN